MFKVITNINDIEGKLPPVSITSLLGRLSTEQDYFNWLWHVSVDSDRDLGYDALITYILPKGFHKHCYDLSMENGLSTLLGGNLNHWSNINNKFNLPELCKSFLRENNTYLLYDKPPFLCQNLISERTPEKAWSHAFYLINLDMTRMARLIKMNKPGPKVLIPFDKKYLIKYV